MYGQKNPILECIVDQCKNDPELSTIESNSSILLENILTCLEETNFVDWSSENDNLILKNEWVEKMKIDSKFYWFHSQSADEMQKYENILISLAAKYLDRKIKLFHNDCNGKISETFFERL